MRWLLIAFIVGDRIFSIVDIISLLRLSGGTSLSMVAEGRSGLGVEGRAELHEEMPTYDSLNTVARRVEHAYVPSPNPAV